MNKYTNILLIHITLILMLNCASQGYPDGGPSDTEPPLLLGVSPSPNSVQIGEKEIIKLTFDEMLDPISVNQSISIIPNTTVNINHYNNTIVIKPEEIWPDGMFQILITRELSDYNSNTLYSPIPLLYSTSNYIESKKIKGQLYNIQDNKKYEIALIDKNYNIINRVPADINGNFELNTFNDIKKNHLVAIENTFSDNLLDDISNKRYGISNRNSLNQHIYISDPQWKLNVKSFELINDNFGIFNLDNNSKIFALINNKELYEHVNLSNNFIYLNNINQNELIFKLENNIEAYEVRYDFSNFSSTIDTIKPNLEYYESSEEGFILDFSEPIIIDNKKFPFYNEKYSNIIGYQYLSPKKLILDHTDFEILNIQCESIVDLNNIALCDTTLTIENNLSFINYDTEKFDFGGIEASINYSGDMPIIVSLKNSKTDKITKIVTSNKEVLMNNLPIGEYFIWAYEHKNSINDNYFSGTLKPLSFSANFFINSQPITVRKNWINNIEITIENE